MTDTQSPSTALATMSYMDMESAAHTIAKSGLFACKTPEQALSLMLLSQSEGVHPMRCVQDFDIIQGRPARKSVSIMARFQAAGGTVKWSELSDEVAKATFSHPAGGSVEMVWTFEMAKAAGLTGKENWQKYPRAMLRNRCVAEGVRTVYPGAIGGLPSSDEAVDMDVVEGQATVTATVVRQPKRKTEGAETPPANGAAPTTHADDDTLAPAGAIKGMLKMAAAKGISQAKIEEEFKVSTDKMTIAVVNSVLEWVRNAALEGDLV